MPSDSKLEEMQTKTTPNTTPLGTPPGTRVSKRKTKGSAKDVTGRMFEAERHALLRRLLAVKSSEAV